MLKWILLYVFVAVIIYVILSVFINESSFMEDFKDESDMEVMPFWLFSMLWGVLIPLVSLFGLFYLITKGSRILSNKIYGFFHKTL